MSAFIAWAIVGMAVYWLIYRMPTKWDRGHKEEDED